MMKQRYMYCGSEGNRFCLRMCCVSENEHLTGTGLMDILGPALATCGG